MLTAITANRRLGRAGGLRDVPVEIAWIIMGVHRFVCLAPVNLFIGFAERAHAAFKLLHKPESHAPLLPARPIAHRALLAALCHSSIAVSNICIFHEHLPQ